MHAKKNRYAALAIFPVIMLFAACSSKEITPPADDSTRDFVGTELSPAFDVALVPVDLSTVEMDERGDIVERKGVINKRVACPRPVITGVPNISTSVIEGRTVFHNYGHGGSGWTLLWGSVHASLDLFKKKFDISTDPTLAQRRIEIVGAGCMGRATAVLLYELGFRNIAVVAEQTDNIASINAAGHFAPVSMDLETPEQNQFVDELGFDTYKKYKQIYDGEDPLFKNGVEQLFVYTGAESDVGAIETESGLEPYAAANIIPPAEEVFINFGNGRRHRMRRFQTFLMDTEVLMQTFDTMMRDRGISVTIKKVESFNEFPSEAIIFNCSGLGAIKLNKDEKLYPILGHLLSLVGQTSQRHKYVIYSKYLMSPAANEQEKRDAPYVYFMPRGGGILGGTFIPNRTEEDPDLNRAQFDALLRRNIHFFGIGPHGTLLEPPPAP